MATKTLVLNNFGPRLSVETKSFASSRSSRKMSLGKKRFSGILSLLSTAMLLFSVVISGAHLFTVNIYAAKGFELKQHHMKVAELEEQGKKLMVKQAEIASLAQLNDLANAQGLVPVTIEEFVNNPQFSQR